MVKRSKSFKKIIVSLIVIGAVSIAVTQSSFYRRISQSQRLFNQIYNQIFSTYLHELNPEEFTKATINSITANLDPYTSYMVEEEQHQMNILSKGKYGGVGIQLSYRNEQMIVIAPMDGGPAQTAGILSGDIILKVDDALVKNMTFNDAAAKIRGLKGSEVVLTIKRYGEDDPIDFKLIRSDIKVKDITYSGMVSPTTGYVRLNRFSRNTTSEMNEAFKDLIKNDVKEVIIDLRDNGGGLLTAAVNMIDMLIEKGQTIVSTKGRMKESNRSFLSRTKPIIDKDVKIAILINQGSASASEIVAGSIQDLDRGIVIGRKSFGKGLVQTLYPIDKVRSLKVTTARYYIPSGRFIQNNDYINEKVVLESEQEDSIFTTLNGRKVLGNGGITPDSIIYSETMEPLTVQYWRSGFFYSFAQENKFQYEKFKDVENDNELMSKFNNFILTKNKVRLPGEEVLEEIEEKMTALGKIDNKTKKAMNDLGLFFKNQKNDRMVSENTDMKQLLLLEFAGLFNGPEGRIKQALKDDKVVQSAINILSSDNSYQIIGHTLVKHVLFNLWSDQIEITGTFLWSN